MASRSFNVLSLCSGYGGLELGLGLALPDARTVCFVEREAYAAEILAARMQEGHLDGAPVWTDLTTFDGEPWRGVVDCITAGFPCQPWSTASRGRPSANDLRDDIARIVAECRPRYVFAENVQKEAVIGLGQRLTGYGYGIARVSTAFVGATDNRRRWWLLAYPDRDRKPGFTLYAEMAGNPSIARFSPWSVKPTLDRMANGTARRLDRLRACGNGVVPVVAAVAFLTLAERAGLVPELTDGR